MDSFSFGNGNKPFIIITGMGIKSSLDSISLIKKNYSKLVNNYKIYILDREMTIQDGFSIDGFTDEVYSFIKDNNLVNPIVYGISQGGMVASLLAINYPGLVSKLILASTSCRKTPTSINTMDNWIDLSNKKDSVGLTKSFISKVYSNRYGNLLLKVLDVDNIQYKDLELTRFSNLAKANIGFDIYSKLDYITCPTLIIAGSNDKVLGLDGSMDFINKLHCKYHIYEGCSHAVYDEKINDVINDILDFVKE